MIKISKVFYPKAKHNLIRLGKDFDGGYVVEKNSILNSEILLSFGLNDDWSFEEDFSRLGNKIVYCYDYSVNRRFWIVNFLKSFLNIFLLKMPIKNFNQLFIYKKYKKFFNKKNNFHYKKYISPDSMKKNIFENNKHESLKKIAHNIKKNFFLKIDIEGGEYRILNEILINANKINGLVIEFHDFDLHYDVIKKFIENFELKLAHIHANNFGSVDKNGLPSVVELTFTKSKFCRNELINDNFYPVEKLDMPNNEDMPDIEISFY